VRRCRRPGRSPCRRRLAGGRPDRHWQGEACHIGAVARERARERLVAELRDELATQKRALAGIVDDLGRVERRQRRLDDEVRRRPSHAALDATAREQAKAAARVEAAEESRDDAVHRLGEAERTASDALRHLTVVAAERGLPTDSDALDRLEEAVAGLAMAVDAWFHAHVAARQTRELVQARNDAARDAAAASEDACTEAALAQETRVGLQSRLEAVESAVGASYEQVIKQIEQSGRNLEEVRDTLRVVEKTQRTLLSRQGELDATRQRDARERDDAVGARDVAGAGFRALIGGFLPEDAGIDLDVSGVRPTLGQPVRRRVLCRMNHGTWPTPSRYWKPSTAP
jgi:chromosome segregation ATPase